MIYLNDGAGRFALAGPEAGVDDPRFGMGAATGDIDNDGDVDLLVTNVGRQTMYRNLGDGTFEDITVASGLEHRLFGMSDSVDTRQAGAGLTSPLRRRIGGPPTYDKPNKRYASSPSNPHLAASVSGIARAYKKAWAQVCCP